ncbi:hypothetical protein [Mitsuaria sp. GD03876]|uniref:hypothetical protein n=1 Tax=Mitsuaria sp. GD03876 TaxID=2975399 RepID=UPI002447C4FD|nr:hypothetical protein [Mitsuaria sp. GD03876]MDH0865694.1 hypothetical protein [Mitsuaria sp. GD03876]
MSFQIRPMSVTDWRSCWRDAVTDPECSPWLRGVLDSCIDAKNAHWIRLPVRWAVDAVTGDYLVRLPSLIGRQITDQFCARVGERLYGLCGLGVGDPKVFFAGGSSPPYETMAQVHAVLTAAFGVHGSYAEDIGRDPIREPVFIPGALMPEELAAATRGY